jgi:hypothetical protein
LLPQLWPRETNVTLPEVAALYWDDPLGFAQDCFEPGSLDLDEWQRAFLTDLSIEVKQRNFDPVAQVPVAPIRMVVASGHGIGKSTLSAVLFWWVMVTRPYCIICVTANTWAQVEKTTWKDILRWGRKCLFGEWFEMLATVVRHKEYPTEWYGKPAASEEGNSEAFQGQQNARSSSVFIFDEASKIPDIIWEVAQYGQTSGEPMWFAFGNPTMNTGEFFEACWGKSAQRWNSRSINSMECKFPNKEELQKDIDEWGWESDRVRIRIRGLAPHQSQDQFIGRDLVAEAQGRRVIPLPSDPLIAGVDVPDGGSGWFVVRFRRGLESAPGGFVPRPIRVAGSQIDRDRMVDVLRELLLDERPEHVISAMFIDSQPGAAIVERLKAWRHNNVHEVSFGRPVAWPEYSNMRAYMWSKMKDWLRRGSIDANDKKLAEDLVAPGFHYKVGGDGSLVLESKDDMKKRGQPSPDDGDALALTFAMEVVPEPPKRRPSPSPSPTRRGRGTNWMLLP